MCKTDYSFSMLNLDNPRPRPNDTRPHIAPPLEHTPGRFEKIALVGQILASLLPVTNGLLVVAHASNGEMADAAQSALNALQGLLVVAGMEVIRGVSKVSDDALKETKIKSAVKK